MRKIAVISLLFLSACASKSRTPSAAEVVVTPPPAGALTLDQALLQGQDATIEHLKGQIKAEAYTSLQTREPAADMPQSIRAERIKNDDPNKKQQSAFLRKFRGWSSHKRVTHGGELVADFNCDKALESQALGYSLELDFPEAQARDVSKQLHEKVLGCDNISKTESVFRLAVFAIQQNECPRAMEYIDKYPAPPERGMRDRQAYLKSFCAVTTAENTKANPLGGYGILVSNFQTPAAPVQWYLDTSSGDADWDRLLASMIKATEENHPETVQYLASKMNLEKFRSLPLPFQTSMLVLMSANGADLSVFQALHKYLADHPDTLTTSAASLLFPIRYWKEIVENSKSADPILVKALIRQESAFNRTARSRARASGLMQLIYPTAKHFGVKKPVQLLNPETNIHAGSEFLAQLIADFGSVELALAAYNAGPAMVRQWQKRYPTENIDLFVEMIPYTETREYVRLVKRNYKIYQSILVKPQVLGANH
ncbi:lytic transglycosylase domain-containing protein [Bdellovibrio sp. HCB209]|uniref:lytic transglycosylase domain-containing protein n=1 Tax=Bdellovibrio sp. HCB209 TaxID=3394354 RepID=UPI0039B56855